MNDILILPIADSSQVGEARRATVEMAGRLGFDSTNVGKAALIVTEAATNLVKHAGRGELILRPLTHPSGTGLEILVLDKGPGIENIQACLRNGYSTAGSLGTGLGAIARLATCFDIHSVPGVGTALMAHLWSGPPPQPASPAGLEIGVVCAPKRGESVCGDAWAVVAGPEWSLVFIVDGLGHGPDAAAAAAAAVTVFHDNTTRAPAAVLEAVHAALRSTRGGAAAVAAVDWAKAEVRYSGVGNISGQILSPVGRRHLVSYNGTVGHTARKILELVYPWPSDARLVMYSDGLGMHWDLNKYPGLADRHPSLMAGVLYRDFGRTYDDVTVLVAGGLRT